MRSAFAYRIVVGFSLAAQLVVNVAFAAAAEADAEAPSPPPAPVKRYATFASPDSAADALGELLPFDDVETVQEGDGSYWRVYRTAARGERGVIVLAAAAAVAPAAPSLNSLRQSLPRWGWSTLSVPLPEAPSPPLPERDRFHPEPPASDAEGEGSDAPASGRAGSKPAAEDEDAADEWVPPVRPEPASYDRQALAERDAAARQAHRIRLTARLIDTVAAARARSAGGPVVVLAAGDAARWVAAAGTEPGADALVLIDLDVVGSEQADVREALAELTLPALILQHAPRRWHPGHRLGAAVELHLLPTRSEQRLARRVHGYLKRNTKRASRG